MDDVFDALVGEAQYVKLTRSVIEPIVFGGGAGYVVEITMDPVVCDVCLEVSGDRAQEKVQSSRGKF